MKKKTLNIKLYYTGTKKAALRQAHILLNWGEINHPLFLTTVTGSGNNKMI